MRLQERKAAREIVLMGTAEAKPLPAVTIARAIGRGLYRYRSELMPFYLGLLVTALGAWMHATRPGAWPVPLVLAALVVVGLLRFGERASRGLRKLLLGTARGRAADLDPGRATAMDRPIERYYAAIVAGYAGLWLAGVAGLGWTDLIRWGLILGVIVLGGPWWAHTTRRSKVAVDRRIVEPWPVISEAAGLIGSKITKVNVTSWGKELRVRLRMGQHFGDAVAATSRLESALDARPSSISAQMDPNRARVVVYRVVERDPWAGVIHTPLPEPGTGSVHDPWPAGVFDDATVCYVQTIERHLSIYGQTGSGKSVLLESLLGWTSACNDVVMLGIDMSNGATLEPWADCFLEPPATDVVSALELLARIERAVTYREGLLARAKAAAVRADREAPSAIKPSPQSPAIDVFIEEHPALIAAMPNGEHDLEQIARRARKTAIRLRLASQNATVNDVGSTELRAQFATVIGLRLDQQQSKNLWGAPGQNGGWSSSNITTNGGFLLRDGEHTTPREAKGYMLANRTKTIRANSAVRPQLDPGTARALGLRSAAQAGPAGADPSDQAEAGPIYAYAEVIRPPALPAAGDDDVIEAELVDDDPPAPARQADTGPELDSVDTALVDAIRAAGPGGARTGDLVTLAGLHRSNVTNRLKRLVDAGLICRSGRGMWAWARTEAST